MRGAGSGFQTGQVLIDDLRRGVVILSKLTGWGLADILDLEADEFWAWLKTARSVLKTARSVENEIATELRSK